MIASALVTKYPDVVGDTSLIIRRPTAAAPASAIRTGFGFAFVIACFP
jgi:hypothetical protein